MGGVWALGSDDLTEVGLHGKWLTTAEEYARDICRLSETIGGMLWAAPQAWMCDPEILKKTGLSVEEHQRRTVQSVLELRALGAPVIPVLHGCTISQYYDCWDMYADAGVDLVDEKIVGIGSAYRHETPIRDERIVQSLASDGLRLHGFGFKLDELKSCWKLLASSDSIAWTLSARQSEPLQECAGKHKNCKSCMRYALQWRKDLLASTERNAA